MFGKVCSLQGLRMEREWRFSLRRINDDVARNEHKLKGTCLSIRDEVLLKESIYRDVSSSFSDEELLRNRR